MGATGKPPEKSPNPAPATSVDTPFETTQTAYFLSKKPLSGHLQDTFFRNLFLIFKMRR